MEELLKILKPVRKKLIFENWLKWFLSIGTMAMGLILMLFLLSKIVVITYLVEIFIFIIVSVLICSVAMAFFFDKTTYYKTARVVDNLGYEERFITALELLENGDSDNKMNGLVIEDAILKGKSAQLRKKYKLKVSIKLLKIGALLLIASIATGFIENPSAKVEEIISEEMNTVEEIKKAVNKEKDISKAELKELNKQINTLIKEIGKSKTQGEAVKAIQKTGQELKKLEKKSVDEGLKSLGAKLAQSQSTSELGAAMEIGEQNKIGQQLQKVNDALSGMTEQERKEYTDALQDAAKAAGSEELRQVISNYAGEVADGNYNASANGLENLNQQLSKSASQNQELREGINEINSELAEASQGLQGQSQPSKMESNNPGEKGNGSSEGNGQGTGEKSGAGQGQGQGQGEGQGGKGRGFGHSESEKVFTREAQQLAGYDTNIKGVQNEGGETQQSQQKTVGSAGESIPYDSVYNEYKNQALSEIENSNVPYGMKSLVEEYFSTLEK